MKGKRGFFGVAILHPKKEVNVGGLCRSAAILGAAFVAVIGRRFQPQASDTMKSYRHVPFFEFESFEEFYSKLPYGSKLVGIELSERATDLASFTHPEQAVYILGAEDHGLPDQVMDRCHALVRLRGDFSMNVAVAGTIVLYHRVGYE